jgi:hypothetical protein
VIDNVVHHFGEPVLADRPKIPGNIVEDRRRKFSPDLAFVKALYLEDGLVSVLRSPITPRLCLALGFEETVAHHCLQMAVDRLTCHPKSPTGHCGEIVWVLIDVIHDELPDLPGTLELGHFHDLIVNIHGRIVNDMY